MRSLVREGSPYNEIAVLYRSNAQSRVIEHALFSANMPYRVYGGLRFFEQAHVKDVAAFMKFAVNRQDEVSFMRMVKPPT